APDALGRTEYLYLSRGAELDMNGYPQTISKLLTAAGSVLNIHGGSLADDSNLLIMIYCQIMPLSSDDTCFDNDSVFPCDTGNRYSWW
uniref:hypothetical protein n=1 Tax=Escherichia coli TaxID=562 RepID=UPI001FF55DF4